MVDRLLIQGLGLLNSTTPPQEGTNAVVVCDGLVEKIGDGSKLEREYGPDRVLDYPNGILMPGLVNSHTHSVQAFLRGAAEDLSLLDWLNQVILPGEATMTAEEVYASSLLGYMDLVSHGTTFANDMLTVRHTEAGLRAGRDIGVRARVGKMLMDDGRIPSLLRQETTEALEESHHLIEGWHKQTPLIDYSLNPRFLLTCSAELMRGCAHLMEEHPGVGFHTHANENREETRLAKKIHGRPYIEALHHYGTLSPQSVIAHGIWLEPREQQILAETQTGVVHNPSANAKLASGVCDWPGLQQQGVRVGLGTDGPPCNNTMDLFREMRLACFLQRISKLDETVAPAHQVFGLATFEGARMLGRPDLGQLKEGFPADLLVLDVGSPDHWPLHDYLAHVVFRATGEDVTSTFVAGTMVYNKQGKTVDEQFPRVPPGTVPTVLARARKYMVDKPWLTRDPN